VTVHSGERHATVRAVKDRVEPQLLALPGVVAVSVGRKVIGGTVTTQRAIVVAVRRKIARHLVDPADAVPAEIDGVPTDVVEPT
jgi:hypothetical protein